MAPTRVIIDTDPGNDDMLAMLLLLCSKASEIEVLLISVTFGNVEAERCLRNVAAMFHIIEQEMKWREANGRPIGFESLRACKPIVAIGATEPVEGEKAAADYYHGIDGLGNVSQSHPHLNPPDSWQEAFQEGSSESKKPLLFTPSRKHAVDEIIRLLDENEPGTISILPIGPLSNISMVAAKSPKSLLRAKEVVIMGGAVDLHGNMTPLAEFNFFADPTAAARVFALTSPNPITTLPPPQTDGSNNDLASTYSQIGKLDPLNIVLFPLDITEKHMMYPSDVHDAAAHLAEAGSPFAEWVSAWMAATFQKYEDLHIGKINMALHDPMCAWWAVDSARNPGAWTLSKPEDIRIETRGQWTRGACIVDRRSRQKMAEVDASGAFGYVTGDHDGWLSLERGNRVRRCLKSPGERVLAKLLMDTIFG